MLLVLLLFCVIFIKSRIYVNKRIVIIARHVWKIKKIHNNIHKYIRHKDTGQAIQKLITTIKEIKREVLMAQVLRGRNQQ